MCFIFLNHSCSNLHVISCDFNIDILRYFMLWFVANDFKWFQWFWSVFNNFYLRPAPSAHAYFFCQERRKRKIRKTKTKLNWGQLMMKVVLFGWDGLGWNVLDMLGSVWLVVHDCSGSVMFWGVLDGFWVPDDFHMCSMCFIVFICFQQWYFMLFQSISSYLNTLCWFWFVFKICMFGPTHYPTHIFVARKERKERQGRSRQNWIGEPPWCRLWGLDGTDFFRWAWNGLDMNGHGEDGFGMVRICLFKPGL